MFFNHFYPHLLLVRSIFWWMWNLSKPTQSNPINITIYRTPSLLLVYINLHPLLNTQPLMVCFHRFLPDPRITLVDHQVWVNLCADVHTYFGWLDMIRLMKHQLMIFGKPWHVFPGCCIFEGPFHHIPSAAVFETHETLFFSNGFTDSN